MGPFCRDGVLGRIKVGVGGFSRCRRCGRRGLVGAGGRGFLCGGGLVPGVGGVRRTTVVPLCGSPLLACGRVALRQVAAFAAPASPAGYAVPGRCPPEVSPLLPAPPSSWQWQVHRRHVTPLPYAPRKRCPGAVAVTQWSPWRPPKKNAWCPTMIPGATMTPRHRRLRHDPDPPARSPMRTSAHPSPQGADTHHHPTPNTNHPPRQATGRVDV